MFACHCSVVLLLSRTNLRRTRDEVCNETMKDSNPPGIGGGTMTPGGEVHRVRSDRAQRGN